MNICEWCEEPTDNERESDVKYHVLCDDCYNDYHDKTGYCDLSCCMNGNCSGAC